MELLTLQTFKIKLAIRMRDQIQILESDLQLLLLPPPLLQIRLLLQLQLPLLIHTSLFKVTDPFTIRIKSHQLLKLPLFQLQLLNRWVASELSWKVIQSILDLGGKLKLKRKNNRVEVTLNKRMLNNPK